MRYNFQYKYIKLVLAHIVKYIESIEYFVYVCVCCYSRNLEQNKLCHWKVSLHTRESSCCIIVFRIIFLWQQHHYLKMALILKYFSRWALFRFMIALHPVQCKLISEVWVSKWTSGRYSDISNIQITSLVLSRPLSISLKNFDSTCRSQ